MFRKILFLLAISILLIPFMSCGERKLNLNEISIGAGAGLKNALDPIAEKFTEETGIKVNVQYLCSAMVLSSMILTTEADLFLPGSEFFMGKAQEAGVVIDESIKDGAYMVPVITTPKGNPQNIKTLADFTKPGVKVGFGDFENLAVGRVTKEMFEAIDMLEAACNNQVHTAVSASKLQVTVGLGHLDAAINWYCEVQKWLDKSECIYIEPGVFKYSIAPIGITKYSQRQENAQKFIDYMRGPTGQKILLESGYFLPDIYTDAKKHT